MHGTQHRIETRRFERADEALYLAKERGRDCVCLHDGDDARQSA